MATFDTHRIGMGVQSRHISHEKHMSRRKMSLARPPVTTTASDSLVQGYARVFNVDQETALPRPDEDLRLEAALAVKANGALP